MARETPPFEEFVAVRAPALLRTAFLLTGDWLRAADLVHVTLLRCYRRWRRIAEPEAYTLEVLVRSYVGWRSRRWRGGSPATGSDLPESLSRLRPLHRAVAVLRDYEDLPQSVVARMLEVSVAAVQSVPVLGPTDVDALRTAARQPPLPAGMADEVAAHHQRRRRAAVVTMTSGCLVGAVAVVAPNIGGTDRPLTGPDQPTPTATATFRLSDPLPRPSVPITLGPRAGASLGGVFANAVQAALSGDVVRGGRFVLPVLIDGGALRIKPTGSDVSPRAPARLRQLYEAAGLAESSVQPVARGYADVRIRVPGAPRPAPQRQPAYVALAWRPPSPCQGLEAAGSYVALIVFTDPARPPLVYRGAGLSCAQAPRPPAVRRAE